MGERGGGGGSSNDVERSLKYGAVRKTLESSGCLTSAALEFPQRLRRQLSAGCGCCGKYPALTLIPCPVCPASTVCLCLWANGVHTAGGCSPCRRLRHATLVAHRGLPDATEISAGCWCHAQHRHQPVITPPSHTTATDRHQRSLRKICCTAAFFKPWVGGAQILRKLQKWQNPEANTKECISRHPAKMNTTESFHGWSCCSPSSSYFRFLSILLTYMIAKCRNISLLILRRSCVGMCPNKLKVLSNCLLQTVCGTPGCLLVPLGLCCPLLSRFNSRHQKTK